MAKKRQEEPREIPELTDEDGSLGSRVRFSRRGEDDAKAPADIHDLLKPEEVEKMEADLDKLTAELQSADLEGIRRANEALKTRAPQDADTLAAAYKLRAYIERNVPNWEGSAFAEKHATAQRVIDSVKEKNPHAVVLNAERLEKRNQEVRDARRASAIEEIKALRDQASLSLHQACEPGAKGNVAVRVEYDERDREGKSTGRTRHGWVLIEVQDGWGRIKSVAPERGPRFLLKYGNDRDGNPRYVVLEPTNDFRPDRGPRFPDILERALVRKYADEEAYREQSARTRTLLGKSEIRATQLVAGEKGFCSFHVPHWSARSPEGEIRGSITLGFEGDGEGHIVLRECVTDKFSVTNYVGETYSLPLGEGDVPTFLRRLLQARVSYEARKAAEENESPTDELPEEDAPTAEVEETTTE